MKIRELFPILFWIAVGLYVSFTSRGLGVGTLYYPGPGLMPFYLGVGLTLISLVMLFLLFVKKSGEGKEAKFSWGRINYSKIAVVVGALIIYSLVIDQLGYIVATLILMFIMFWGAGSKKTYAVIASLLAVLITYFVFTYLGLRFPPGILEALGL
jgi:putative tricarboxylic transport membrane protein